MGKGRFRADLFYRLNVAPISVPPLQDRLEDIPVLVDHFIAHFNKVFARRIEAITPAALENLMCRRWPGNVRQLKNLVEYAFLTAEGRLIELDHLAVSDSESVWPFVERRKGDRAGKLESSAQLSQDTELDAGRLRQALEQHRWSIKRTAAALNLHRTTLWRYMQRHGLSKKP